MRMHCTHAVPLLPQNVLIGEHGLLKIADLGISQVLDHVFTRVLVSSRSFACTRAVCSSCFHPGWQIPTTAAGCQ